MTESEWQTGLRNGSQKELQSGWRMEPQRASPNEQQVVNELTVE